MRAAASNWTSGRAVAGLAAMVVLGSGLLASAGTALAAEHVIEIRRFKFVPATVNVRIGDTVKWINRDIAPHTATATDKSWDTKQVQRQKSSSVTVTKGMGGAYFCRYHPHMKGMLVIVGGR